MIGALSLVAGSFLAGSIPSAYIAGRIAGKGDIRKLGSGNAGATNAFRVLGWKAALPVLCFDFCKGLIPVILAYRMTLNADFPPAALACLAGTAALLGHLFPAFIGFRGGKGVATGAGMLTALVPPLFPACLAVFIPVLAATRRVSPASIAAALAVPVWYAIFARMGITEAQWPVTVLVCLVPVLVILRHRKNIARLLGGTEARLF
jgi:glycerol-3-phosphate acyltransferase PlsY